MNLKQRFFSENEEERFYYEDDLLISKMTDRLLNWMPKVNKDIVIVCIGTDRSTGDALGPLIGSTLDEKQLSTLHVYGTLEDPVHAVNLTEKLAEINNSFHNPFIIGVDACLGKSSSVGTIVSGKGPVKPGAAVKKQLPDVGDIHVTGIVNVSGFMEYFVLQNTRLNTVMKMAKKIASVFEEIDNRIESEIQPPNIHLRKVRDRLNNLMN